MPCPVLAQPENISIRINSEEADLVCLHFFFSEWHQNAATNFILHDAAIHVPWSQMNMFSMLVITSSAQKGDRFKMRMGWSHLFCHRIRETEEDEQGSWKSVNFGGAERKSGYSHSHSIYNNNTGNSTEVKHERCEEIKRDKWPKCHCKAAVITGS